jgi:hypothetical protein
MNIKLLYINFIYCIYIRFLNNFPSYTLKWLKNDKNKEVQYHLKYFLG